MLGGGNYKMSNWFIEPTSNDTGGLYEFIRYTNVASEGLFFPLILLAIWMIVFVSLLFSGNLDRPSASKSWITASFIILISSIPLSLMDLLNSRYVYISILLLGIGIVWIVLESRE